MDINYNLYKNHKSVLLCYIKENISNEDIIKILDLQYGFIASIDKMSSSLYYLSSKDKIFLEEIFYKYIECENPLFNYKHLNKYLKYNNIAYYNYNMIKVYDSLGKIDLYYKRAEENESEKNISLLLYYYILNKSKDEIEELIEKVINSDKVFVKKVLNEKTKQLIVFDLVFDALTLTNVLSMFRIHDRLFNFIDSDIFYNLTSSQKARLFKKLSGYHNTDMYKVVYNKLKLDITPNQFYDLKPKFDKDDIIKYCKIVKEYNKDIDYYIVKGIRGKLSGLTLTFYFETMFSHDLINDNNSTDIFLNLMSFKEFHTYGKIYNKYICEIYKLFIMNNLNINRVEKYLKSGNVFIGSIYKDNYAYMHHKRDTFENTISELNFLKRNYLIKKIKDNINGKSEINHI